MSVLAAMGGPEQSFYGVMFLAFAVAVGVALIVSLLGILFMTLVVAPNATQRFTTALRERNVRSFFVGLPVLGVFLLGGAITHKAPALFAVASMGLGVALVLGFAAASEDIGRRLFWACGKEGSRATHMAAGWIVFAFGSLFPVLGWFIILPWVAVSGLGSLVVGSFSASGPAAKDAEFEPKA